MPGTTSGRSAFDTPKAVVPVNTLTGSAERAVKIVSTDHRLRIALHTGPSDGDGIAQVRPPRSVWRTSKSAGPQSTSGSTLTAGNAGIVSFEVLSLEFASVYETSACKPLDNRRVYLTCSALY